MIDFELTYKPYGETSILIEWPSKIDEIIIQDIIAFEKLITKEQKVISTTIAYNSILVNYEFMYNYESHYKHVNDFSNSVKRLKELYAERIITKNNNQKTWQIPVCYDIEFGLDLEELSQIKNISVDEIISLHTKPNYLIYFLGFQPGFMYLGGLNAKLHQPRKATPRLRLDKGSVGIGGEQTGIYPLDSSGGWNIIGKSPLTFFDVSKPNPCFAKSGDKIQFTPISVDDFHEIESQVKSNKYKIKFI